MMNGKRAVTVKKLLNVILALMITGCFLYGIINITFASGVLDEPDVTITIDSTGQITSQGDILGDGFWYPGNKESGTIRVVSSNGLEISRLGLKIDLLSFQPAYNQQTVYDSFLKNMKLTFKKGVFLNFTETIFENRSLYELVSNNGFELKDSEHIKIIKNGFVDLEYTLTMDDEAGQELEDLKTKIDFLFNVGDLL